MEPDRCRLERNQQGAILVRVASGGTNGQRLPDAVFTFWRGDPQYDYWEDRLRAGDSAE